MEAAAGWRAARGNGRLKGSEGAMDKVIRKYASYREMKADEYRYWQSRPGHERMEAVAELTLAAYALKGKLADVPRLQGPLVRLPRPRR